MFVDLLLDALLRQTAEEGLDHRVVPAVARAAHTGFEAVRAAAVPPRVATRLGALGATLEWVDWFNHRRLLEPIGYLPPAEFEARDYQQAAVA